MARKVMLEAQQALVHGNQTVVESGTLFELGADLPEGLVCREVIVDVPGKRR